MRARQGIAVASLVMVVVAGLVGCARPAPEQEEAAAVDSRCGEPTVTVSSSAQLFDALEAVTPGDSIELAPGVYLGTFTAAVSGTEEDPISLCGPSDAILDGGDIEGGYVLHLDSVSHWVVEGFAIRGGQKGLMADTVTHTVIRGLTVSEIGDEGIHLRATSTDNLVIGNTISDTGMRKPKFGEGIYIGTAESNWCEVSDCEPDRSDRNVIEDNTILRTTAESIDIKEGTSEGVVRGNTFDGAHITGADSWVDVKGNDWLIVDNVGTNAPRDGFQTHEILDGWGTRNVFRDNSATVLAAGFGYSMTPELENVVECGNTASEAREGVSNVECSSP